MGVEERYALSQDLQQHIGLPAGQAHPTTPTQPLPATTVQTETSFGQSSAVGTAETYAREDHTHGTPAAPSVPSGSSTVTAETAFGQSANAGSASSYSKGDHTHGTPALSPASTVQSETAFGGSSQVGTGSNYAREDHKHGNPSLSAASTVQAETSFGQSSAVGTSANYAREDHKHGTPTAPTSMITVFHDVGGTSTTGTTYVEGSITRFKLDWWPLASSSGCYFDAILTPLGGGTAYAEIYSVTDSASVSGSEVSSATTGARARSGAITLRNDKEYCIRIKHGTGGGPPWAILNAARIILPLA